MKSEIIFFIDVINKIYVLFFHSIQSTGNTLPVADLLVLLWIFMNKFKYKNYLGILSGCFAHVSVVNLYDEIEKLVWLAVLILHPQEVERLVKSKVEAILSRHIQGGAL